MKQLNLRDMFKKASKTACTSCMMYITHVNVELPDIKVKNK
jgi:predicted dithiol-disulfide oxidoreductase (DUF899 family)